jgi:riboflavin synthase
MFTGIVEQVGSVRDVVAREDSMRLTISASTVLDGLRVGDSIAIEGVCQTVVDIDDAGFSVDTVATTLSRTTLGALAPGAPVNLERALALGGRLGGHLVQGHVDAVGVVRAVAPGDGHTLLDVAIPDIVADVTVLHGSIAISGVSLTVNALPAKDVVQVALIPFTWQNTTLSRLRVGDHVNLEGDLFGKFVVHYLMRRAGTRV